ncbi:MAG: ATP-dependent DNA helicase RecG [Myxococcaceae bacterium]
MGRPHFTRLAAPLRFLAQRDFRALGRVRGLTALLEASLQEARAAGAPAVEVRLLSEALAAALGASLEGQVAALRRLSECVQAAAEASPVSPTVLAKAVAAPSASPKKSPAARPRAVPPAARPRKPRSPKPKPPEAETSPAPRTLSIAPRAGPLAVPLRRSGVRINPRLLSALEKKGLSRVGDILFLLPRGYEDRRRLSSLRELVPGVRGVTVGTVRAAGEVVLRPGRRVFRAVLSDATGTLALTYFQTGPWMKGRFPLGQRLIVSGELRVSPVGREMVHPEVEPAEEGQGAGVHFGRIVPLYSGFERHEQRQIRALAHAIARDASAAVPDPVPPPVLRRLGLLPLPQALARLHSPLDGDELAALDAHQGAAHRRLAFDELFFLHLGLALRRQGVKSSPGIRFAVDEGRLARARGLLPFRPTRAQERAFLEIARDMGRPEPMHRLLQGDVGSGKTAVAAMAAALAVQDGWQVALMAPTEILAAQHAKTLAKLLAPLEVEVALVTGAGPVASRRRARAHVASGRAAVAVGTQALIQEGATFHRLGLALIDEQHRFGVLQRQALAGKGPRPDVLVMTATPIPRTLAMTLYGDLDLSVLDELPPGRTPILTRVIAAKDRARVWAGVAAELARGHQAYVLYPLVEASEKVDLLDATRGAQELQAAFPEARVRLLHGQMASEEKQETMEAFRRGEVQILVCTTVVEVGVDVVNATLMVVESAERFGLSQLHQLRGRVGRGTAPGQCFLLAGFTGGPEALARLRILEDTGDGFVVAQRDLELRGQGEFLGTRQSGVPEFAVANLARDQALSAVAAEEARSIAEADPTLSRPEHAPLVLALEERWEGRLALAGVG